MSEALAVAAMVFFHADLLATMIAWYANVWTCNRVSFLLPSTSSVACRSLKQNNIHIILLALAESVKGA